MPGPTLISDADLSGLLKNFYTQYRIKAQNTVTPLFAQLQRAKSGGPRNIRWGGNGAFWDVITGRPAGGTFSAAGFFPPDTFAQEKQASTGVARAYVTRQIDGLVGLGTKSKEVAFDTILRKTAEEITDASRLLMQAALHGAGQGVMAIVGTVTNSTTIIVAKPYGVTGAGQGSLLLSSGDYIAVLDTTGATLRGKSNIASIGTVGATSANATLTLTTAIAGMVATDIVVKATVSDTSYSSTAGANVINGLINITDRGGSYTTLHGLSASTYPIWDCVAMVAGTDTPDATQATESDVWDLIKRTAGWSGKDAMMNPKEFLLMTTPGVAKNIMESFVGQRRFPSEGFDKNIKGGYRSVEICGIPCFEDYYCPAGTIYLIHLPSVAWVDAKDWGFVEFEGSGAWRWIQGRDAFETSHSWIGNMVALQRNAHSSISGYTFDTTFYTHVSK